MYTKFLSDPCELSTWWPDPFACEARTMSQTPADVAALVLQRHGEELESQRSSVLALLTSKLLPGDIAPDTPRPSIVRGPSVADASIEVRVGLSWDDPAPFGTFARDTGSTLVRVALNAHRDHNHGRPWGKVDISPSEAEGWARAALGHKWSDYAYRLDTWPGRFMVRPVFFAVFVDQLGLPHLAPSDFQWDRAGSGGAVERHKLTPESSNADLVTYLQRHGDVIPATDIAHPAGEQESSWYWSFGSALLSELADHARTRTTAVGEVAKVELTGNTLTIGIRGSDHDADTRRTGFRVELDSWRQHIEASHHDSRAERAAREFAAQYLVLSDNNFNPIGHGVSRIK